MIKTLVLFQTAVKQVHKTTKHQHLSGNSMYIEIDHKLVPRKIFDINDWTSLPTDEPKIDSDKESDSDEDKFGPRGFGFDRSRRNSNETRRMNVNKEEVQKGDFNSALMHFMKQKEREGSSTLLRSTRKWLSIYHLIVFSLSPMAKAMFLDSLISVLNSPSELAKKVALQQTNLEMILKKMKKYDTWVIA